MVKGLKEREELKVKWRRPKKSSSCCRRMYRRTLRARQTSPASDKAMVGIGGDYFDYLALGTDVAIAMGDVSNHGVGPALVMAMTRAPDPLLRENKFR